MAERGAAIMPANETIMPANETIELVGGPEDGRLIPLTAICGGLRPVLKRIRWTGGPMNEYRRCGERKYRYVKSIND